MDEIFHIPQARRMVCNMSTAWDDKITTPPGLYLLSAPVQWLAGSCGSIASLRSFVFLFVFFVFYCNLY